jgi:hypothetical protein
MIHFDDLKPTIVWAGCLMVSTIENNLNVIAGILSISYTAYKFYTHFKNNNEK